MTIILLLYNVKLSLFIVDHYGLDSSLMSVHCKRWTDSVRLNIISLVIQLQASTHHCNEQLKISPKSSHRKNYTDGMYSE